MSSRCNRSILLVCLAFCVLAVAFIFAIACSDLASRRIGGFVDDITENANPSVIHLVRERNILSQLQLELMSKWHHGGPRELAGWTLEPALLQQDDEWRAYDATPQFAGEASLRDRVLPQLDELKALLRAIVTTAARGDDAATVSRLVAEASGAFQATGEGLMDLIVLNHHDGHTAALRVEDARRLASRLAWGLGAGALVLSAVLLVFIVRALRRTARLQAERDGVLQQRAIEHEMFAARVAHDIRAPLAVAQLYVDRIRRHPAEQQLALSKLDTTLTLQKLDTTLKRAGQIIDDLYEFARVNVAHRGQETPLREAVKYAVDELEARAASSGVEVTTAPIPDATIAAAPGVVATVLSNLLSNAVKYAGRGARVTVQALVGDRVRVNIADTGVGIPQEVQTRIFEPYVRGNEQDRFGGLGLGLATVKQLVERSGGSCGVESKPGNGSLFWFELPRLNGSTPATA